MERGAGAGPVYKTVAGRAMNIIVTCYSFRFYVLHDAEMQCK